MKKLLIFAIIMFAAGILMPVYADTMNYKIKQEGASMIIVPSQPLIQKPILQTTPAKIPYYSQKSLPKGRNRTRFV